MPRHSARRTALIMLVIGFVISVLATKFYIEDSYAEIAEAGLIGTPSVAGLFVLLGFVWIAGIIIFLILHVIRFIRYRKEGLTFGWFLKELLIFLLMSLLFFPLALAAMYAGSMLVRLP